MEQKYYLVTEKALPKTLLKVLDAKKLLKSGEVKTSSEAAKAAGISRSVFYKYKDCIKTFKDVSTEKVVTVSAVLKDSPGVLSKILNEISSLNANILTINQNIPVDSLAPVTVSLQWPENDDIDLLIKSIENTEGVLSAEIISGL